MGTNAITSPLQVESHEMACKVLGKDASAVTSYHEMQDDIAKAINKLDNFEPSFENQERKYTPWMVVDVSGFRFDFSFFDDSTSDSFVGSRLCLRFRTREISDFFAEKHIELHKKAYYGK